MTLTPIDSFIVLILLLLFVLGCFKGFLKQTVYLCVIFTSVLLTKNYGSSLNSWLELMVGLNVSLRAFITYSIIWGGVFFSFLTLSFFINKVIEKKYFLKSLNTIFGGFLLSIEGLAIFCFCLFLLNIILIIGILPNPDQISNSIHRSVILKELSINNPLLRLSQLKSFQLFFELQNINNENPSELLQHQKVRALLDDNEVEELIQNKKIFEFLNHPKVIELTNDEEIQNIIKNSFNHPVSGDSPQESQEPALLEPIYS